MFIDLNRNFNAKTMLFPDNQPHTRIEPIFDNSFADVCVSLVDSISVMNLLQASEAIDGLFKTKRNLYIPYLMGARYDRRMVKGDSVDLKVIAKLINSCGFEMVHLLDVHSDTALQLIDRSVNIPNYDLCREYTRTNAVMVVPDGGAIKRCSESARFLHLSDTVYCIKKRNVLTGELSLEVLEPQKCEGKHIVVVDDLCDGGGTFNLIASKITNAKSKTLIVTHSIFSKGLKELTENFDEIITTDSYIIHSHGKVTQISARKMMIPNFVVDLGQPI